MSNTLKDFTIPDDREKIEAIKINSFKSLTSPEKIEKCLIACPNVNRLSIELMIDNPPEGEENFSFGDIISIIATYGKNIDTLHFSTSLLLDEDLRFISNKSLPLLRTLVMPYCKSIKALGIKYIATQCPELTSLIMFYSLYNETDEAAFHIGKYLPNLKHLDLHRACNLSDAGLIAIAEGCKKLEIIGVGRNYELTDESLKKVAEHCKELVTLSMFYNSKVTPKGFEYIAEGCPKFKNFRHGGWGTIPGIREMKLKYPHIDC